MKIGIIGTESTHAASFSHIINKEFQTEEQFRDVKVNYVWGQDCKRTDQIAHDSSIPFIVSFPEEMLGHVDAVMILERRGNLHLDMAMPFLKAGIPVFIDKPFAGTSDDARKIIQVANQYGARIYGGSTCRYVSAVSNMKRTIQERGMNSLKTAYMQFPADDSNPYGGLEFYGSHLVEMCLSIFGTDYHNVVVTRSADTITAVVAYSSFTVSLNFIRDCKKSMMNAFFVDDVVETEIDISNCYALGMRAFLKGLLNPDSAYDPNYFIEAVTLMNQIQNGNLPKN